MWEYIKKALEFFNTPTGRTLIRAAPFVIREIDSWISTHSYNVAKQKIEQIKQEDASSLKKIYNERKNDMSETVRLLWEKALRERGEL